MVTTSIGCEGIEVTDGESALVADTAGEFASAVVTLLGSEGLRRRLATRGFELVRKRYEWSAIGEQMENVYAGIMRCARADSARAVELR
jgi:glycosyltransferase involved in cell wall biosynthesis